MLYMRYFIFNLFYVSVPTMSQADFPIRRASACILGQFDLGGRLVRALFLQCVQVLGLRLSGVVALVALSVFRSKLLVRFITSATSLELVTTNASLLIVISAIVAVSCSRTTSSVVAAAARLSK